MSKGFLMFLSFPIFLGAIVFFIIKFAPPDAIVTIFGKPDNPVSKLLCSYPMVMSDDTMEPQIDINTTVIVNRCIEDKTQLTIGTVIVYNLDPLKKMGIIRDFEIIGDKMWYVVSNRQSPNDRFKVSADSVFAVVPETVDVSE